jgi:hypothetical protein
MKNMTELMCQVLFNFQGPLPSRLEVLFLIGAPI